MTNNSAIKTELKHLSLSGICVCCLNAERKMFRRTECLDCYKYLGEIAVPGDLDIKLCYECDALLHKISEFQKQIKKSHHILIGYIKNQAVPIDPIDLKALAVKRLTLSEQQCIISLEANSSDQLFDEQLRSEDEKMDINIQDAGKTYIKTEKTEVFINESKEYEFETDDIEIADSDSYVNKELIKSNVKKEFIDVDDENGLTDPEDEKELTDSDGENGLSYSDVKTEFIDVEKELSDYDDQKIVSDKLDEDKDNCLLLSRKEVMLSIDDSSLSNDDSDYRSNTLSQFLAEDDPTKMKINKTNSEKKESPRPLRIQTAYRSFNPKDVQLIEVTKEEMKEIMKKDARNPLFEKIPYKCLKCLMKYTNKEYLFLHNKMRHSIPRNYYCVICKTHLSGSFTTHLETHKYCLSCKRCDYKTVLSQHMDNHLKQHGNVLPKLSERQNTLKFKCELCPEKFASRQRMVAHINKKHKNGKINVKPKSNLVLHCCDTCSRKYKSKPSLNRHKLLHSLSSEVGGKIHLKEDDCFSKTWECQFCGRVFITQPNYNWHIQYVHKIFENPIPCDISKKTFENEVDLKIHMKHVIRTYEKRKKENVEMDIDVSNTIDNTDNQNHKNTNE